MMDDFNDFTKAYAICTYLKSYGYKAQVDQYTLTTHVQDPKHVDPFSPVLNTFVVLPITTWEQAREFIKVRSQS